MDAKEFDAIGTLIESRILQMTPERRDSMIHLFERLSRGFVGDGNGALIVVKHEGHVEIMAVNLDELEASELMGVCAIKLHEEMMSGAPESGLLN
jgi:hypothetical protein